MTIYQLPGGDTRLDDLVARRNREIDEAWELAAYEADADAPLDTSLQIADLQHWLDLCA